MIFKERICKYCKAKYKPEKPKQIVCSAECAIGWSEKQRTKQLHTQARMERKALREKKLAMKSRKEWLKDVERVFNAYIRARDAHLPCISCETTNPNIQYCAGHYRTVGSSPHLRFDERNVNKQCNKNCNMEKSGNIHKYRIGLIKKYGLEVVEALEADNTQRHYTIDDLKALKVHYQAKIKELERMG